MGLFGNLFSSAPQPQPQLQAQAQPAAKAKSPRSDETAVAESIRAINRAGFRQSHPSVDISSTTNTSALVVKAGGVENCATVAVLTAVPVEVEEHEDERTVEVAALEEKPTKSTTAEYQHNDGGEGVDADEISSKCVELGSGTNRTNSGQPPLKTPVNQSSFAKFELTANTPQHFVNAPQLAKSPELLPAETSKKDANTEPFKSTLDEQSSGGSSDRHANDFLLKAVLGGAKKGASGRPAAAHVQGLGSRQDDSEPAGLLTFNNLLGRGFNNLLGGPGSGKRVIVPNQFGLQVSAAMESSSMSQTEQPSGSAGVANGAIPMSIASQLSTGQTQGNGNGVEQNMSLVSMSSGVSSLHVPILNIRKPFLAPDVAKADRVEEKKALRTGKIPFVSCSVRHSVRLSKKVNTYLFTVIAVLAIFSPVLVPIFTAAVSSFAGMDASLGCELGELSCASFCIRYQPEDGRCESTLGAAPLLNGADARTSGMVPGHRGHCSERSRPRTC
eukprot:g4283.t1